MVGGRQPDGARLTPGSPGSTRSQDPPKGPSGGSRVLLVNDLHGGTILYGTADADIACVGTDGVVEVLDASGHVLARAGETVNLMGGASAEATFDAC